MNTGAVPVIAVVGPTASGKSDLGVALAEALHGEVVNADSMQLYRGMDVGTAKLTVAERHGVPHHLLDVWPVTRTANVAEYQTLARVEADRLIARDRPPVFVGGSGLYLRGALDEFEFPGTDGLIRERLEAELAEAGPFALHQRLAEHDPQAARTILPSNGRRIVRALEVIELTGGRFTATLPEHTAHYPRTVHLGLDVDRPALDERIALRVDRMWEAGLVKEVRELEPQGLRDGLTASRALGYAQVLRFLSGEWTEEQAKEETVRATKRFARRQDSWFRRDPRVHWLRYDRSDLVEAALDRIGGMILDGLPARTTLTKGHGTENDFVIVPDPDGALAAQLTPARVAALCDRRAGIGADGVLRVVRTAKMPGYEDQAAEAEFFMDYRNADGSVAEMCGNGVRVFALFLTSRGLLKGGAVGEPVEFAVGTRGGIKRVTLKATGENTAEVTVDMGVPEFPRKRGAVTVDVKGTPQPAVDVDMGNPHAVVFVDSTADAGTLYEMPTVSPAGVYAEGVNVEFAADVAPRHLAMRVYERGVGETRSCGTGACAVMIAAARRDAAEAGTEYTVDVPGGRLRFVERADGHLEMTGPAALVFTITPVGIMPSAAPANR